MDTPNEIKRNEDVAKNNPPQQNKMRHNPKNKNNSDLWIHVDAQNSDASKFLALMTVMASMSAIGLGAVALTQHNQINVLLNQNKTMIDKYDQTLIQMDKNYVEAMEDLEAGLNAVVNSINNISVSVNPDGVTVTDPVAPPVEVVPEEDKAFLGISVMNDETATTLLGVRIAGVYEYSPAARAGMRAGDIIMALDGTTVDTFETLSAIIDTKKPGDALIIRFARTENNTVYFEDIEVILDSMSNYDTTNSQE